MKILVTGATGFLGFRLLEHLKAAGHEVVGTGRNPVMAEKIRYLGIPFTAADIQDADLLTQMTQGLDAVVHTAGLSSPWGAYEAFYQANVVGTEQVVAACLKNQVRRLVHISSPSIYVRNADCVDIKESDPLPERFLNHYATTKFLAEKVVARGQEQGLETVMLRPRALVGRGDTVIVPRLLRAHQQGRLRVIGNGQNIVDLTPVANVCQAIELALHTRTGCGEVFNISNGEPVRLWDTLAEVFQRLDLKLNRQKIPFAVAYALAAGMEMAAQADPQHEEPALTRYSVIMISRSQTLNIDKARQLLGYQPQQSLEQAIAEFVEWWKHQHWQ